MKVRMIILLCLFWTTGYSQKERIYTRSGNAEYLRGDFSAAQEKYENSLEIKENYKEGNFNLGNSLQRQADEILLSVESASEEEKQVLLEKAKQLNKKAAEYYQKITAEIENKEEKSNAFYNQGNAELKSGDIQKAIESYKNALRNNPTDENARYNLAYAQQLLKEQQQQQQQQDQQQDQEKQDQENKDQQNQDQQNQNQQENEQQEQQGQQPDQLSREDAEKMLDALNQDEKNIQEKIKKERHKGVRIKTEKDW